MDDILMREEALHPELVDYVQEGPLGPMIHHPLIISITYMEKYCGLINAQYSQKKAMLKKAVAAEDYPRAINIHERPYRSDALMEYINDYGFEDHPSFWPTVAAVWIDSENIGQSIHNWRCIWNSSAPNRDLVMDKNEKRLFDGFDDTVRIYRGGNPDGMSWTLDYEKALWFARRFDGVGKVTTGYIAKSDILAYFDGRGEAEIVTFPKKVRHEKA